MSTDLGELYAAARRRITEIAIGLPEAEAHKPCPATPEWTVHEVLAHVRGITEDVRTGNLDGVATDPWTAAQVDRHRASSTAELLDGWAQDAPILESVLSSPLGETAARAVIDVHAHEADLRSALGHPASLPTPFGDWAIPILAQGFIDEVQANALPTVRIVTPDGDAIGASDAPVVLNVSRFDLFRSRLGRRSRAQVASFDWGGADPKPYFDAFFSFGPRDTDLNE
jgi:uncharacterized protein (TIGR03083 family)